MDSIESSDARQDWRRNRRMVAYAFTTLLVLLGVAIVLSAIFRWQGGQMGGPFFGFGWIWAIFGFFFLFWLFKWIFWPWRPYHYRYWGWRNYDAVAILRARYARGEITKEQFEQMMQELRQTTNST